MKLGCSCRRRVRIITTRFRWLQQKKYKIVVDSYTPEFQYLLRIIIRIKGLQPKTGMPRKKVWPTELNGAQGS